MNDEDRRFLTSYFSSGSADLNITCGAVDYEPLDTMGDEEGPGFHYGSLDAMDDVEPYEEELAADKPGNETSDGENIQEMLIIIYLCLLCMV